jgi:hypothetical protein
MITIMFVRSLLFSLWFGTMLYGPIPWYVSATSYNGPDVTSSLSSSSSSSQSNYLLQPPQQPFLQYSIRSGKKIRGHNHIHIPTGTHQLLLLPTLAHLNHDNTMKQRDWKMIGCAPHRDIGDMPKRSLSTISLPNPVLEELVVLSYDTTKDQSDLCQVPPVRSSFCREEEITIWDMVSPTTSSQTTGMITLQNSMPGYDVSSIDNVHMNPIDTKIVPRTNMDSKTNTGSTRHRRQRRLKTNPTKLQRPSAWMTNIYSKLQITIQTIATMISILNQMIVLLRKQMPKLVVLWNALRSILYIAWRDIHTTISTHVIPSVQQEWHKYQPMIWLFLVQERQKFLQYYTQSTTILPAPQQQQQPWQLSPSKKNNCTTIVMHDHPLVVISDQNNTTTTEEEDLVVLGSTGEAAAMMMCPVVVVIATAETPLSTTTNVVDMQDVDGDWNDTIMAFVVRLSIMMILCYVLAISQ